MKKTTIASLMATAIVLPQLASGAIILAGWHEFTANESTVVSANSKANEGVTGIYNSPNTNASHRQTTTTPGGSTDGWYGPDSVALGGERTEQVFSNPPGYTAESTAPANPRFTNPFVDGADYSGLPANTNFDGRITNLNGTDVTVTNNSTTTYYLQSFVFDAFLGDSSANTGSAVLNPFTYTVGTTTVTLLPSYGVAGVNSVPGYGPQDTVFPGPTAVVPNVIDYGTGTNYVDYVINLGGIAFAPGDSFTIGFSSTGSGVIRLDNIALFAVPEPSSVMTLAALVGTGCFFRRRKLASAI